MIGTSLLEYLFIRACILGLQSVAPVSVICCLTSLFCHVTKHPAPFDIPWPLQLWAGAEVIFYIFVSLIYREKLQYEALHPAAPARNEREELFELCNRSIPDHEAYLKKWFLGASANEIKRENVKEFFLWAFFNRDGPPGEDDEELEGYVIRTERLLGRKIEQGRGNAICLRLTIDGVSMSHRSILWYFVSSGHHYQPISSLTTITVRGVCRFPHLRTPPVLWLFFPSDNLSALLDDISTAAPQPLLQQSLSCQTTHLLVPCPYFED